MKENPFKFRLERVRQVRVHAEDRAKEELAQSLGRQHERELQLQATDDRLTAARIHHRAGTGVPLSGAALVSMQAYVERLEQTRSDAALRLAACEAEVAQRRSSLTGASREREVLDRLADRQRQAHRLDEARREGSFLDEIAIQNYARRGAAA